MATSTRVRRGIPTPALSPRNQALRFSFKHLDADHPRFGMSHCSSEYFRGLLERLRLYSAGSVDEFLDQNNKEHRHLIDFEATSEKDGFMGAPGVDEDQLNYAQAWHFGVAAKTDWRVHGFFIEDTFYVVWLDPWHRLAGSEV